MLPGRICLKFGSAAAAAVMLLSSSGALAADSTGAQLISLDRGRRDRPRVALTFDGGSGAGDTERILAVLEERVLTATFFLTGEFIERFPDLVRRIAAGGHEVGNHTWSHPHLTAWDRSHRQNTLPGVDRALVLREISATAAAYERLARGPMAPLWRAPYGELNAEIAGWAGAAGWRHVGWSREEGGGRHTLDSLDWVSDRGSRNYLTSEQIATRILTFDAAGNGLNGGIVLMHLCTRQEDPLAGRLGSLIDALRARGYELTTVGGLRRDLEPPETILA
ncbi:MAG TPA: polysaccharide deacetylase family protein, partial [Candidatus Methanoperedens sp.]|nr:polysaccharide deacetylase family protein [Candidatus Methanoperedens sp.]